MYCSNKIVYTIKSGDSLYKLARQYMTTVTELILGNPGVNPYNLQIGMKLNICPGPGYQVPEEERTDMKDEMDRAWLEHVYWNRMFMTSMPTDMPATTPRGNQQGMPDMSPRGTQQDMPDMSPRDVQQNRNGMMSQPMTQMQMQMTNQQATRERMMRNVGEIVNTFSGYLTPTEQTQLRNLMTEHEEIGGEMMDLLQDRDMDRYQREVNAWYENAAKMAELLAPNMESGSEAELRRLLFEHLDLLRQEMEEYFNGDYQKSIETFDIAAEQVEKLADYIASRLR